MPQDEVLRNNSHQFSDGNAIEYFNSVQLLCAMYCFISEELVTTHAVGSDVSTTTSLV